MKLTTLVLTIGLCCCLLLGCDSGPKLIQAGGRITFRGEPVADADVTFIPVSGGRPVFGRTDGSGKFELTTDGQSGASVGQYKVGIQAVRQKRPVSAADATAMTDAQIAANHESVIPIKYGNDISSGLTATVSDDPDVNQFNFDLK